MELIELISIRIDEVRSQRGQDITELARRAGIKNKTLWKTLWKTLHGNREMKADELVALCYVLKLDFNHFINEKIQEDLDARCWKAIRDLSTNPHSFER